MTHPLLTDPITDMLTDTMTHYLFSLLSDAHSAHLLIPLLYNDSLLCTILRHGPPYI
jgi:hypothetical protein